MHALNGEKAVCEIIMLEKEFKDSDKLLLGLGMTNQKQGIIALPSNLIEKIPALLQTWNKVEYRLLPRGHSR